MWRSIVSNRVEILGEQLAARLAADPLPLLMRETIVVPSSALARWLEFRLADALGIAAHIDWAFPAEFAWRLIAAVLPEVGEENPFAACRMRWRLLRLCQESAEAALAAYLADDDGRKGWELARRLAALYGRYLVERPEWLMTWAHGQRLGLGADEHWQAALWQRLIAELSVNGLEHPMERFFARLASDAKARERLPRRLTMFCSSEDLPELYWRFFTRLADYCEIEAYALSPSREYWAEIVHPRQRLRLALERPEAAALFEVGHPLLASLARGRRHVVARLAEMAQCEEHYVAPPPTLLGRLQADLMTLAESVGEADDDGTIEFHACHGPQREAEVLADRLLALFERWPQLQPADILILTPDVETYGPVLQAALEEAPTPRRIPCRIADMPLREASSLRALMRLSETLNGDFSAESVLGLLDERLIRRAFALSEEEIGYLREWVAEAGARWGIDGAFRAARGAPDEETHSWRFALRRLLVSVAMPDETALYEDLVPVVGIEGSGAELLGRFLDFLEALFAVAREWSATMPPAAGWARLRMLAERFLLPEEEEMEEWLRLIRALDELAAITKAAGVQRPVAITVLLAELAESLGARASPRAFASGRATIAALAPGRPLPARVVCLVGMNEGSWPQAGWPDSFDLLAQKPRPSDIDRRNEERYALLSALLSARDALLVTFTGADPHGHAEFPPAAPVAEIIDAVARLTNQSATALVIRHPLQPFAAEYCNGRDRRLFTYAEECFPEQGQEGRGFGAVALAKPATAAPQEVERDRLAAALTAPARFFLRDCLGVTLEAGAACIEEHEPFIVAGLDEHRLRTTIAEMQRRGLSNTEAYARARGEGLLPHGIGGKIVFFERESEIAVLLASVRAAAGGETPSRLPFAVEVGGWRVTGAFEGVTRAGLIGWRAGRLRVRDRLCCWLDHLLWQLVAPAEASRASAFFALDGRLRFAPLQDAALHLTYWLDLYRRAQVQPLPFHPETAWEFALGRSGWRRKFFGSVFEQGELERDPYLALAWRDREEEALGEEFQELARRIYQPLREAMG